MIIEKVKSDEVGVRIDRIVKKRLEEYPLSAIFSAFRKGKIKVNGKKVEGSYRLCEGDEITYHQLTLSEVIPIKIASLSIGQEEKTRMLSQIVYENENWLLYAKRGNETVHRGSGHDAGVVEKLRYLLQCSDLTPINRLDKGTSGLVILGKNLPMIRQLNEWLREDKISKNYLAICYGSNATSMSISDKLLVTEERVVVSEQGKESTTNVVVKRSVGKQHLLHLELITGRKHQLRVHLSHHKLPIIGDYKYGIKVGKIMYLCAYQLNIEPLNFHFELKNVYNEYNKTLEKSLV